MRVAVADAVRSAVVFALVAGCGPSVAVDGSTGSSTTSTTSTSDSPSGDSTAVVDESESSEATSGSIYHPDLGWPTGCGDGRLDDGEICDDGNVEVGDGCNADCTLGGQLVWERALAHDDDSDTFANDVAVDSRGRLWLVGRTRPSMSTSSGWLVVLDGEGSPLFDLTEGAPETGTGFGRIAIGSSDRVVIAGAQDGRATVWCVSAELELLWSWADLDAQARVSDLVLDPAGDILITTVNALPTPYLPRVTRLSAAGEHEWTLSPGFEPVTPGAALGIDSNGAIILGWGDGDRMVLRKHTGDLEELWTTAFEQDMWAFAVAVDADDGVVVAGLSSDFYRTRIAKHAGADGALSWERELAAPEPELYSPGGLAIDHAGRTILVGLHLPSDTGLTQGMFARKIDADGEDVWTYEPPFVEDEGPVAYGVALDADEHVIVAGNRLQSDGRNDAWVAKLTP